MSAMLDVETVSFENDAGQVLYGTMHKPIERSDSLPIVVLLSPGVKMRVGPGRLYVPLTEMLCAEGFTVLRFDFFGLGDSEGELSEELLADVYNHIEVGRYVDDTLSALRWLREEHGAKQFVVGGLCGGAITGLLAAQRDQSAVGLLSLGMTVTLASNSATPGKYLTSTQLDERRKGYFRNLLSLTSWWRLLTFKSEYSVIWHSLRQLFVKKRPVQAPAADAENLEQRGNANPLFPSAYFAFLERGGKAFMLFSEKDRLQSEYEEKFAEPYAARLVNYEGQIEKHVVRNANHVLAFHEWQQEMVEAARQWMHKHFAPMAIRQD